MSFKIPCGGFRLDEESFSLDENGVLSVSGGGSDFIVNFSSDDGQTWTCDKTLAEITEAINSGKEVVGSLMGGMKIDFLNQAPNGNVVFGRVLPDYRTLLSFFIIVSEDKVEVTAASIEMTSLGG